MAMASVDSAVQRFIRAMKDGNDMRKLHSLLSMIPKDDLTAWADNNGQDVLHHAVLLGNAEAVDFLLKLGYFAAPYEPQVNMYAHLAARLGFRNVLCTILQHRPEDFKVALQPLVLPPDTESSRRYNERKPSSRELELVMPAVVGSQVFTDSKEGKVVSGKETNLHVCCIARTANHYNSSNLAISDSHRKSSLTSVDDLRHAATRGVRLSEQVGVRFHDKGTHRRSSFRPPEMVSLTESSMQNKRRYSYGGEESSGVYYMNDYRSLKPKPLKSTPLEVAARARHVDCVKVLLDMYVLRAHPEKGSKGYLTMASLVNNYSALKLLVEPYGGGTNDHNVKDDYRQAVQVCVQGVYNECLEALLNIELVDPKLIFKHINYFHVMYSQPFNTYQNVVALARLPVMTQNLIDRGHDVKVKVPPRSYALYSLLDNAFSCTDYTYSEYIITCIKLLMDNGADPNFDEVGQLQKAMAWGAKVEHERHLPPFRNFGGRYAYSSALHCLIQSLERRVNPTCKSQAIRFVEECVDAFITYNANIEILGCIDVDNNQLRGDVLWQFARSSVNMGLERGLLHCLTRFGAQPQRKINGQFALNVYLDTLCALMTRDTTNAQEHLSKRERDLGQIVCLMCSFMAPWHIKAVTDIFNYRHKKCSGEPHTLFKKRVNEALEGQSKLIHTLRTITAWQVWKLCRRNANNVKKLPIAKDLKMHVLPLVLFQTLW